MVDNIKTSAQELLEDYYGESMTRDILSSLEVGGFTIVSKEEMKNILENFKTLAKAKDI